MKIFDLTAICAADRTFGTWLFTTMWSKLEEIARVARMPCPHSGLLRDYFVHRVTDAGFDPIRHEAPPGPWLRVDSATASGSAGRSSACAKSWISALPASAVASESSHINAGRARKYRRCAVRAWEATRVTRIGGLDSRSSSSGRPVTIFLVFVFALASLRMTDAFAQAPFSGEVDDYEHSYSRTTAIAVGVVEAILDTVVQFPRGLRQGQLVQFSPEQWLTSPPSAVAANATQWVESSDNALGRRIGGRSLPPPPFRAMLFLREIPEGNTTAIRGIRWILPAEPVGIRDGLIVLKDSASTAREVERIGSVARRLDPHEVARRASSVCIAEKIAEGIVCPNTPGGACARFRVLATLKGGSMDSTIVVFSYPPRGFADGISLLMLGTRENGTYRIMSGGRGAFAVSNGKLLKTEATVSSIRSGLKSGPRAE